MQVKKIVVVIVVLGASFGVMAQSEELSLYRNSKIIRNWVSAPEDSKFDVTQNIDTVTTLLNSGNTPVSQAIKYHARLSLDWYYIHTNQTNKIDYDDLYNTILNTRGAKSFLDVCYAECAQEAGRKYLYNDKNYECAFKSYFMARNALTQICNDSLSYFAVGLYKNLANIAVEVKEFKEAAKFQSMALQCLQKNPSFQQMSDKYHSDLKQLGILYAVAGEYQKSDSCLALCEDFLIKNSDNNAVAEHFSDRADNHKNMGHYSKAIEFYRKSNEYQKDPGRKLKNVHSIALIQVRYGNGKDIVNTIDEAVGIIKNHYDYIQEYDVYNIVLLSCSGDFNANKQQNELLTIINKHDSNNSIFLSAAKAQSYFVNGKYSKGNYYKDIAVRLVDEKLKKENADLNELTALATTLIKMGDSDKAIEIVAKELEFAEKEVGKKHSTYRSFLYQLASLKVMYGDDVKDAENLADSLLAITPNGTPGYFDCLKLKAEIANYRGQWLVAADYYREMRNGANTDYYGNLINEIGALICEMDMRRTNADSRGRNDSLILWLDKTMEKALAIGEKLFEKTSDRYFSLLAYKVSVLYFKGEMQKMAETISEMENIIGHAPNKVTKEAQKQSVAMDYAMMGDYGKALALMKNFNPEVAESDKIKFYNYSLLAEMNFGAGNSTQALKYYEQMVNSGIQNIKKDFPILTAAERSVYWNVFKQAFYDAGKYATVLDKQAEFNGTLYDMALYSKGLLIRSQTAINEKIKSFGDTTLITNLQLIKQLRMAVANGKGNGLNVRNLENDAEQLEKELMQKCLNLGYDVSGEFSDFQAIKTNLSDKDAAIEFILYHDKDTVGHYGALVLRKDYGSPVLVHIAEKEQLERNLAFNRKTSQMVWNPILPFIKNAVNVYFSPIGAIHKFAIEYLPADDKEFVADKFNLYRVSSTTEIVRKKSRHTEPIENAIVYGGINYDTDTLTMAEVVAEQTRSHTGSGALSYLAGTLTEAQSIRDVFSNKNIQTDFYDDVLATEESFKKLSGHKNSVIHIGTHGFCNVTDNDLLLSISGKQLNVDGDNAMYNSGLYFSGANNTLRGKHTNMLEDGVLSAKEISMLDFSKTDLITLSACVTADGDITGEGVFGVQRGFKLAGANTIVMSCWSVDDAATNILMSSFYGNMAGGMSKTDALLNAVRKVKSIEKYGDAKYWAAFIMVDGEN